MLNELVASGFTVLIRKCSSDRGNASVALAGITVVPISRQHTISTQAILLICIFIAPSLCSYSNGNVSVRFSCSASFFIFSIGITGSLFCSWLFTQPNKMMAAKIRTLAIQITIPLYFFRFFLKIYVIAATANAICAVLKELPAPVPVPARSLKNLPGYSPALLLPAAASYQHGEPEPPASWLLYAPVLR